MLHVHNIHRCSDELLLLQYGDQADKEARERESRSEDILNKQFASKTRVEEHKSQVHEEVKDGKSTKTESRQDKITNAAEKVGDGKDSGKSTTGGQKASHASAGEGGSIKDHE